MFISEIPWISLAALHFGVRKLRLEVAAIRALWAAISVLGFCLRPRGAHAYQGRSQTGLKQLFQVKALKGLLNAFSRL